MSFLKEPFEFVFSRREFKMVSLSPKIGLKYGY